MKCSLKVTTEHSNNPVTICMALKDYDMDAGDPFDGLVVQLPCLSQHVCCLSLPDQLKSHVWIVCGAFEGFEHFYICLQFVHLLKGQRLKSLKLKFLNKYGSEV